MAHVVAERVSCRYGEAQVVREASFAAAAGELTVLLGPNGAGKSTLLRALAGLVPFSGQIRLAGRELGALSRKELAREVGLVSQEPAADIPFTVAEVVLMGRAPHQSALALEGDRDRRIAREAMASAGVLELSQRGIDELSGGERRRVFLARALAQEPRMLLLDEPTAFLDLGHQAQVLEHARTLVRKGLCVIAVLHDPNLAATFADRLVLMKEGQVVGQGAPRELLTAPVLEGLYGARLVETRGPNGEGPFVAVTGERGAE